MATASVMPDRQKRLLQLIECPICLNEQQDPRLLSCRHIYCYKCLRDYHEKGKYRNALPCPQCREVTTLNQGDVDTLPKFFFMNELKEVVMAGDGVRGDKPDKYGSVTCSTENCGQPGLKYCKQCEFLCQQCFDDHSKSRVTQSHQVITASEGAAFTKSELLFYPPCHRHEHKVMDVYCLKCNQPMCSTCSNTTHNGHQQCDLDQHAKVCKTKLEQISEDTDGLIHVVKKTINKTSIHIKQAEADIDDACHNIKSTFKIMHDKLNEEEKTILSDLGEARKRVKHTCDGIVDSQMMTQTSLEKLKSSQIKLADKDSAYDYVTVTDYLIKELDNHFNKELAGITWNSQILRRCESDKLHQGRVDLGKSVIIRKENVTGSVASDKQVDAKEVNRIPLDNWGEGLVQGMVVYNQRVYVVHDKGLKVYCYIPDGSLSHIYSHQGRAYDFDVQGMTLMMDGNKAMLVISGSRSLVWISIIDAVTMKHHHTQQSNDYLGGSYNDSGDLMVCSSSGHKIHRYRHNGWIMSVMNLSDKVYPKRVARHGDSDRYVVTSQAFRSGEDVMLTNSNGQVETHYAGEIQGVKMESASDVITDPHRGVLITDCRQNYVLLLRRTGDVVKILDQHVLSPRILYLDTEHHRLYVSGTDCHKEQHVFVFNYKLPTDKRELTMQITKLHMIIEI